MNLPDSTLTLDETALPYGLQIKRTCEPSAFTPDSRLARAGEYFTHVYQIVHPATGWTSDRFNPAAVEIKYRWTQDQLDRALAKYIAQFERQHPAACRAAQPAPAQTRTDAPLLLAYVSATTLHPAQLKRALKTLKPHAHKYHAVSARRKSDDIKRTVKIVELRVDADAPRTLHLIGTTTAQITLDSAVAPMHRMVSYEALRDWAQGAASAPYTLTFYSDSLALQPIDGPAERRATLRYYEPMKFGKALLGQIKNANGSSVKLPDGQRIVKYIDHRNYQARFYIA